MSPAKLRRPRRPDMRRAVILFPSGFTLGNLFFGVFAIIAASRGDFRQAGVYVLLGGICDALDGRVARATNAGSQFGEELDSLVDAISFGLAPAMIMYFAVLNRDGWDWIWVFLFAACAVMRLARFNIEQAGTAKTYFQGLPSPAAGCTLASYYWFSQSSLYTYGAIDNLPWHVLLRYLMVLLAMLMISNVPYPVFPRTGVRSLRAIGASILLLGSFVLLFVGKLEYFFPLTLAYVAWGPFRWLFGLFERRQPTIPYDLSEGEDDDDEDEYFEPGTSQVHATRQGHRDERVLREDRSKKPRPRADAPEIPRTEERPARPERGERAERGERGERPERPERPQRTEAERAARREKREKRDKREPRPERVPRPPRTDRPADVVVAEGNDSDVVEPVNSADLDSGAEVIGRITSVGEAPSSAPAVEGAAPRKRKRRRRRGERKERGPGTGGPSSSGADDADGGDGNDTNDGGYDDGPDDSGGTASRAEASPYAAPAPPPIPSIAPAAAPQSPPPAAPPSNEPHE
ncbi:MAG: CDP-diacylglycerol--serine O-phosphatidyltransferase [bacterium]